MSGVGGVGGGSNVGWGQFGDNTPDIKNLLESIGEETNDIMNGTGKWPDYVNDMDQAVRDIIQEISNVTPPLTSQKLKAVYDLLGQPSSNVYEPTNLRPLFQALQNGSKDPLTGPFIQIYQAFHQLQNIAPSLLTISSENSLTKPITADVNNIIADICPGGNYYERCLQQFNYGTGPSMRAAIESYDERFDAVTSEINNAYAAGLMSLDQKNTYLLQLGPKKFP